MRRAGIPTMHAGTRFRSRLEARWATFFDAIGWQWEYEPFDLDGYIPDFAILGVRPFLVEVKPALTVAELLDVARTLERTKREILVVGASPRIPSGDDDGYNWAGVLIQRSGPDDGLGDERESYWPAEASWARCRGDEIREHDERGRVVYRDGGCGRVVVWHSEGFYTGYPCTHYNGGGGPGYDPGDDLDGAWADARNRTQWSPA